MGWVAKVSCSNAKEVDQYTWKQVSWRCVDYYWNRCEKTKNLKGVVFMKTINIELNKLAPHIFKDPKVIYQKFRDIVQCTVTT